MKVVRVVQVVVQPVQEARFTGACKSRGGAHPTIEEQCARGWWGYTREPRAQRRSGWGCLLMKLNRSPAANVPFVEVLPVAPRSLPLWSSVGSSFEFVLPVFAHEPFNQGHVFLSVSLVDVMLLEVTEDHRPRRVDAGRCEALLRLTAHVGDMVPGLGAEIRD